MISRRWLIIATLLSLVGLMSAPVGAQAPLPIAFGDPEPSVANWPEAITATLLNNTTDTLEVTVEFTDFVAEESEETWPSAELLRSYPATITIGPAGQASLMAVLSREVPLAPGRYTASLVLAVPSHDAVLRKDVIVAVPTSTISSAGAPAVETWTLNAVRILPFIDPICLRGLATGCTLPLAATGEVSQASTRVGYLANPRGGGLAIDLDDARSADAAARLRLAFDRRWGLTGTYEGTLDLAPQDAGQGDVALTVNVKDIILWPLLTLLLGLAAARFAQRYLTVRRTTLRLLRRLNATGLTFAKLRKSVHGYTVAEDFHAQKGRLDEAIRAWDRGHFGSLTDEEREHFQATILTPLEELEQQTEIWAEFRDRLDRLGRRLLHNARPAIDQAEPPADIELEEPRFYTAARELLRGTKMQMAQVSALARRIDNAAELAVLWGELSQLTVLVRDAIGELHKPGVELSESEAEMLETARHHLNSAARDLWEATDLDDLQRRETQHELVTAQDLTRRLMDPFVYYAGSELTDQIRALEDEAGETAATESFAIQVLGKLQPLVRAYARLEAFRLPHLDLSVYTSLSTDAERSAFTERALLVSERSIAVIALVTALIGGLDRYFTTSFGSLADYLALLTWGLATKAGLDVANVLLSRVARTDK